MSDTRQLHVTMPDGSVWAVPVQAVIDNRLAYYRQIDRQIDRADADDEAPDDHEIRDWAPNNMNRDDVAAVAVKVKDRPDLTPDDMQEGWVNGKHSIVAAPEGSVG